MIEAKKRKPAKPPEDRSEANSAHKSQNWRTRATKGSDNEDPEPEEESSDEESLPEITQKRKLKVAAVIADGDQSGDAILHLPYKDVIPVDHTKDRGTKTIPINRDEKSYQVRANVQKEGLGGALSNKLLDTEIVIRIGDLLGSSPEVREKTRAEITKTRRPVKQKTARKAVMTVEEELLPFSDEELSLEHDALNMDELEPITSVFVTTIADDDYPVGSVVIPDPYLQYLATLDPEEEPKQVYLDPKRVIVARDSAHLRTIHPNINRRGEVESITDSGSQIVSMSYAQALESKLQWDPDIQIYMQSANQHLEKSVGLARNVPFKFGDILVYLQVHIIRGVAYKVLLGRPFEILCASTIQNASDGSQTLTLKDPNTGCRCTMPTSARGRSGPGLKGHKKATVESVPDEDDIAPAASKEPEPLSVEAGFHQSSMT